MIQLNHSTALITGASKGLGAAFAHELAEAGTNLVLVARSGNSLRGLASTLADRHGVKCDVITADLSKPDAVSNILNELRQRGLAIDLLVNNAGVGLTGAFLSHDVGAELETIQVNVNSLVGLSHALGSIMVERGRGGIINLSSNSAFQPLPAMATYAAAKAFVLHFSEALRHELKDTGVHVMAAVPGPTATSFFEGVSVNMKQGQFDNAEEVVQKTLRSFLQGASIAYPSRRSVRLTTLLPRLLPRDTIVNFAAAATQEMGLVGD